MIKSMTGFGRYEAADDDHKITVEMKSVNHRYLETGIKMLHLASSIPQFMSH